MIWPYLAMLSISNSRLLPKEYSFKLFPLLFTIAKNSLAHHQENDFFTPLSMFLKNVMQEAMLSISSWNILKTCIRGLIPNQMNQNLLLVGGWPCWLLFTISPERHCSISVVNKPWLPGQRNNYRSTGTQPYGFVYLLSVAASAIRTELSSCDKFMVCKV